MSANFGVVGLGRIGGGLALQAIGKGMRVAGIDPAGASDELLEAGLIEATTLPELVAALELPRRVLLYVHAGETVDRVLEELSEALQPGDTVADGGNSYWGDSVVRHRRMAERGIRLVDLGTSGGVTGARNGACFMAGGDPEALDLFEPILTQLCVPGGWVRAGGPGAGHFVKLVHNGVEFGMLQAIGEGVALMEQFGQSLPIADVLACWRHGSVVRSWLVDLMEEAYRAHGSLDPVPSYVEDTGEVNWLVRDALEMEVPIPVIAQSIMELFASRDNRRDDHRSVAAMRRGFGGHPYGPDPAIARERRTSRVHS